MRSNFLSGLTPLRAPLAQHWLEEVRFALGVVVAVGGAVVLLTSMLQR